MFETSSNTLNSMAERPHIPRSEPLESLSNPVPHSLPPRGIPKSICIDQALDRALGQALGQSHSPSLLKQDTNGKKSTSDPSYSKPLTKQKDLQNSKSARGRSAKRVGRACDQCSKRRKP